MQRLERIWDNYTESVLGWKWVNRQVDAIIGISLAGGREVNPRASMSCWGFDWQSRTHRCSFIRTCTNTHAVSTSILYDRQGNCMELALCTPIHFPSLELFISFFPHLFTPSPPSAIAPLFIRFQPSVSAPIKCLEVVKLRGWSLWASLRRAPLSLAL